MISPPSTHHPSPAEASIRHPEAWHPSRWDRQPPAVSDPPRGPQTCAPGESLITAEMVQSRIFLKEHTMVLNQCRMVVKHVSNHRLAMACVLLYIYKFVLSIINVALQLHWIFCNVAWGQIGFRIRAWLYGSLDSASTDKLLLNSPPMMRADTAKSIGRCRAETGLATEPTVTRRASEG